MPRLRARRDSNESDIIRRARAIPGFEAISLLPDPKRRLADYLVRGPNHTPGWWVMVEFKQEKGIVAPHQAESARKGWSVVVRTFDELMAVLGIGGT